jgi:ankyrin repeat protein
LNCCELLLKEFQCSPNYPNIYRQTPLHLAFRNERKDIIDLLVSYGGKLNLKDDDGNIPSKVKKSKSQNFLL